MHIPDGYLSPGTAATMYAAMTPVWYAAGRRVRSTLSVRVLPMMALMSAFCFVIQMLNIPLPGGTTGHAVGASLAAITLGPWPAVIAVSVALVIQALLFGDGGITAIGANCFTMAFAQVFVSYYCYRMMSARARTPARHGLAAGISGYIGVNVAAVLTALLLGIQPLLAQAPDGTPLYAPYPLSITLPAMLIGHLVGGFAEAVVAAAGVAYIRSSTPELLLQPGEASPPLPEFWRRMRAAGVALGVLVILTPLGLLAPGTAWGEWSSEQFREIGLGFVPEGLKRWEGFWNAAFSDYAIPGFGPNTGYAASAALGILLIAGIFGLFTFLGRRNAVQNASH